MSRLAAAVVGCWLAAAAAASTRDPFAPPALPRVEAATPLQRLEIDRVRLVALVYQPVARALLEDEAGIGYVAAPGTAIGPRGGTVVAIARGALRIREPTAESDIVLELRGTSGSAR
jgi:hypothetical protein